MLGFSKRVGMLFDMIKAYFACKDTAFQRDTQLFHLFFRLLTGEHASPKAYLLFKTAQK